MVRVYGNNYDLSDVSIDGSQQSEESSFYEDEYDWGEDVQLEDDWRYGRDYDSDIDNETPQARNIIIGLLNRLDEFMPDGEDYNPLEYVILCKGYFYKYHIGDPYFDQFMDYTRHRLINMSNEFVSYAYDGNNYVRNKFIALIHELTEIVKILEFMDEISYYYYVCSVVIKCDLPLDDEYIMAIDVMKYVIPNWLIESIDILRCGDVESNPGPVFSKVQIESEVHCKVFELVDVEELDAIKSLLSLSNVSVKLDWEIKTGCSCLACQVPAESDHKWLMYASEVYHGRRKYEKKFHKFMILMRDKAHGSRAQYYGILAKYLWDYLDKFEAKTSITETMSNLSDVAKNGIKMRPIEISEDTKQYLDEKVDILRSTISGFPDQIAGSFLKAFDFGEWFKTFDGPGGTTSMYIGCAFITLLLWAYPKNRMVWMLAAAYAAYCISKIDCENIKQLVSSWISFTPQTTDNEIGLNVAAETYVELAFEAISLGVFGTALKTSHHADILNKFVDASRTADSMSKFLVKCKEFVLKSITTIAAEFGIQMNREVGPFAKELAAMQKIVHSLHERVEKRTSNAVDAEMARKLKEYDILHRELELKILNVKEHSNIRQILTYNLNRLKDIRTMVSEAGFNKEGNIEPFSVYIAGAPGIGKTDLSDFILRELLTSIMDKASLLDFEENSNRVIFSPSVGSQYYDTYKAQMCIYWADIFSSLCVPGQENEATFWINAFGANVFNLNMANLPEKGKINCVASLLYAVGNKFIYDAAYFKKALANPSALIRRIQANCWVAMVKPQYALKCEKPKDWSALGDVGPNFFNQLESLFPDDFKKGSYPYNVEQLAPFWYKVDKDKVTTPEDEDYNLDVWYFIQWDWENGKPLPGGKICGYRDFVNYNRDAYREHMNNQKNRKNKLKKHTKKMIAQRFKELDLLEPQTTQSEYSDLELLSDNTSATFIPNTRIDDEDFLSDTEFDTVMTHVIEPNKMDLADVLPGDTMVFMREDRGDMRVLVPTTLPQRINMARVKTRLAVQNKEELADYFLNLDQSFDGLSQFVKDYYVACMRAGERISFSNYDKSFNGYPDHPIHVVLEETPFSSMKKFVEWGIKDDMMLHILYAQDYCSDPYSAFVSASSIVYKKITNALSFMAKNTYYWCTNPLVRSICSGVGKGVLVLGTIAGGLFGIVKLIDWIFPKTPPQPHLNWQNRSDEYFRDYYIEYGNGVETVVPHSCMSKNDALYVNKWLGNQYQVKLLRGFNDQELSMNVGKTAYVKILGNVTFLGAHVAFTCDHIFETWFRLCKLPDYKFYKLEFLPLSSSSTIPEFVLNSDEINRIEMIDCGDITLLEFPKSCGKMASCLYDQLLDESSDLYKNICLMKKTKVCMPHKVVTGQVSFDRYNMLYKHRHAITYNLTVDMSRGQNKSGSFENKSYTLRNIAELDGTTEGGQSGELAYIVDTDAAKCNPIPAYLHCAGKNNIGVGILLTKQLFKKWEHKIKPYDISIRPVEDRVKDVEIVVSEFYEPKSTEVEAVTSQPDLVYEVFMPYHRKVATAPKLPMNMNSAIKRTKLFKPLKAKYGMTRYPVPLFSKNVDLLSLARQDYGSNVFHTINVKNVEYVTERLCSWVFNKSSPVKVTRFLSYKEALFGCPEIHLKQIHASTSCGYTLKVTKERLGVPGKGKTWIFTDPQDLTIENDCTRSLQRCYEKSLKQLERGDRILNINMDCLKDEIRTVGKTPRLFCAGDTIYLMLCRAAFGPFAGWIYDNRLKTFFTIGINPYSYEWTILYRMLREMSDLGIFGDFSKFDKRQVIILMNFTRRLYERYYGEDDPMGNKVRALLFEEILNSLHAVPDGDKTAIYEWLHGNSSGNFLTAILNTGSNALSLVCCFCDILLKERGGFNNVKASDIPFDLVMDNTEFKLYGDDSAITVSPQYSCIDFYSLQQSLKTLWNLDYTDELKGVGGDPKPHKPIVEGSFLGRGFRAIMYRAMLRVIAPLRDYSRREAVAYFRTGNPIGFSQSINNSVYEHSLCDYNVFKDWVEFLVSNCREFDLPEPEVTDYFVALDYVLNRDAPLYSPLSSMDVLGYGDFGYSPREEERRCNELGKLLFLDLESKSLSTNNFVESTSSTKTDEEGNYRIQNNDTIEYITMDNKDVVPHVGDGETHQVMSNAADVPGVICDTARTTCFVEAESKIESVWELPKVPSSLDTSYAEIADFLAKPVLIATIDYSTAAVKNGNLLTQSLGNFLVANSYWAHKYEGFGLIRGTWVIRLECNAQPFQLGKVLLHYLPCVNNFLIYEPTWINRHNITNSTTGDSALITKYQHPHVELDIRNTNATLRVPYIAPTDFYQLGSSDTPYDWGTIYVDAICPLLIGAASVETDVYISVYASLEDAEFSAPWVPQTTSGEGMRSMRSKVPREVKEGRGAVSASLSAFSRGFGSLSRVPALAGIAAPLAWATGIASGVAAVFGWGKPRLMSKPNIMIAQHNRYLPTSDGSDVAVQLSLISDNQLQITDKYSLTKKDEMSFNYLMSIPAYVGDLSWTTSNAQGVKLLNAFPVSPANFKVTDLTIHTHTIGWVVGPPVFYLSQFFQYWRGTVKLTLKFIKTQYHSGRLQITFTPGQHYNNAVNVTNGQVAIREIVDIREQEELTLTLPWYLPYKYIPTNGTEGTSPGVSNVMGFLDIVVLNELRAPETCSASIVVQQFWSAGDDFELQVLGPNKAIQGCVFTPQTTDSEEGSLSIVDKPIADMPIAKQSLYNSMIAIGEHFTSVKQLLSRSQQIWNKSAPGGSTMQMWPWGTAAATLTTGGTTASGDWLFDSMSLFAPMYAFFRGGVNVQYSAFDASSATPQNIITACYVPNWFQVFGSSLAAPWTTSNTPANHTGNTSGGNVFGSIITTEFQNTSTYISETPNPQVIVRCPYQSKVPMSLIIPFDGSNSGQFNEPSLPMGCLSLRSADSTESVWTMQRSLADDFQLMFFLNCPPLMTTYTA